MVSANGFGQGGRCKHNYEKILEIILRSILILVASYINLFVYLFIYLLFDMDLQ